MKVEIKIKEGGKWAQPTLKEIAPNGVFDFCVKLKDKESVVKITTSFGECFFVGTGTWYEHFLVQGKPVFRLRDIFESFGMRDIKELSKVFPEAQLLVQESLL